MRIFYSQIDGPKKEFEKGRIYDLTFTKDRKVHHIRFKVSKIGVNSLFGDEVGDDVQEDPIPTGTIILRRQIISEEEYIIGRGYTIRYRDERNKSITGKVLAVTSTQVIIEEVGRIDHKF